MSQASSKKHLNDVWSCLSVKDSFEDLHSMLFSLMTACLSPLRWNKTAVISTVYAKPIAMNMFSLPNSHHPGLVINSTNVINSTEELKLLACREKKHF